MTLERLQKRVDYYFYIESYSCLYEIDNTLKCFGYEIDYEKRKIVKEEQ